MSRYLERAEHTARLVNVNLNLTLDRSPADAARNWGRLLASLPEPPPWALPSASSDSTTTVDLANRASIAACVSAARENARQVREEISSEMWEGINRLYLAAHRSQPEEAEWTASTNEFLTSAIGGAYQFQGLTDATMTHGEGWHFIELGRYLERACSTAALLDLQFRDAAAPGEQPAQVSEYVEWVGLLKSCCAFEAYCQHYTADIRPERIAEFLVLNAEFPRSIHYAVARVKASLSAIASITGRVNTEADRLAGRLVASLNYGKVDEILSDLPSFLQGIVKQNDEIAAAVHGQYVAYPIDSRLRA